MFVTLLSNSHKQISIDCHIVLDRHYDVTNHQTGIAIYGSNVCYAKVSQLFILIDVQFVTKVSGAIRQRVSATKHLAFGKLHPMIVYECTYCM